ncbi:MAG TPA: HigA family addiction module antitoxin [Dietzia timorensis]|uniref:HigA family addiction module antitoxin n=1 Tax=Dietzia timorensis TaxID=499555 RepID=A0A921JYN4_9ACTN|nr:HigA family addiction module antitoxin [Dietzia timorensis]HJE91187.1 HigA family addiction module antitoxin [Dietzia timorensis]
MTITSAVSPGGLLQAELDARGWTVDEFASKLGVSPSHAAELLDDRCTLSEDDSVRIGEVMGSSPHLWLKLQSRYQSWQQMVGRAS